MSEVMTAPIVVDAWKAPIYEQHLTAAGLTFTSTPGIGPMKAMVCIRVDYSRDQVPLLRIAAAKAMGVASFLRNMPGAPN